MPHRTTYAEPTRQTADDFRPIADVSCLARAGEIERAERLFEQLAGYANDLGLPVEEIDKARGACA